MPQHNSKNNSRKRGIAADRRRERQEEAQERGRLRAQRTPDEQLVKLQERGITTGREWNRLTAKIDSSQSKFKAS